MPSHFFSGIVFPYIKVAEEPGYCQTYLNADQKRKFCEQYSVLRKNGKATPVVFEHEDERVIGDIVSYYIDDKENLCVVGRLEDATYAKQLMQQNGKIGLSLKMDHVGAPVMEGGQLARIGIKEKDLIHVGIVSEPAFEESLVDVFTDDADHMANTYKTYAEKGFYVSQYDKEQYFSNKESLSSPTPTPTPSFETDASLAEVYQSFTTVASKFANMDPNNPQVPGNSMADIGAALGLPTQQQGITVPATMAPAAVAAQQQQQQQGGAQVGRPDAKRKADETSGLEARRDELEERLSKAEEVQKMLESKGITDMNALNDIIAKAGQWREIEKKKMEEEANIVVQEVKDAISYMPEDKKIAALKNLKEILAKNDKNALETLRIVTAASKEAAQQHKRAEQQLTLLNKQIAENKQKEALEKKASRLGGIFDSGITFKTEKFASSSPVAKSNSSPFNSELKLDDSFLDQIMGFGSSSSGIDSMSIDAPETPSSGSTFTTTTTASAQTPAAAAPATHVNNAPAAKEEPLYMQHMRARLSSNLKMAFGDLNVDSYQSVIEEKLSDTVRVALSSHDHYAPEYRAAEMIGVKDTTHVPSSWTYDSGSRGFLIE